MPNCAVTVLEQLEQPCKKLFATGNGRCNLTNKNASGYETTSAFFKSLGLVMKESDEGRIYPYSNQASSVVNTLLRACEKYDIEIVTNCFVKSAEHLDNRFFIYTTKGVFSADRLILATGGMAQSALGSNGSGYKIAKAFKHTTTELSPALVQLKSSNKNCRALKGVRTKCDVKIETNGKIVASEFGELLFTEYGISGIVVMNLSTYINDKRLQNGEDKSIAIIDFVPEMTVDELERHYNMYNTFEGILPERLCTILAKQAKGNANLMAKYIKNWRLIITGTKGFNFAQITKGGIKLSEINGNNESLLCKGLYVVGELTDNQFECGGFNLDYAFSSGIRAANSITNTAKNYDKN
jgi:predicted Rossmann fold flavoprotein